MKLIAESGSTRTEWALVEDNHLIQREFCPICAYLPLTPQCDLRQYAD